MNDLKILDSPVKTPGWIEGRMIKCGKQSCKCSKGLLHGPYFYYRYWKLEHRKWKPKKKYVDRETGENLIKAIDNYRVFITNMEEDPYRALRRQVQQNIKLGITEMTQRKLSKAAAKVKGFIHQ